MSKRESVTNDAPKTSKIEARRRFAGMYDIETDFGQATILRGFDNTWCVYVPFDRDLEDCASTFSEAKALLVAGLELKSERENRYETANAGDASS